MYTMSHSSRHLCTRQQQQCIMTKCPAQHAQTTMCDLWPQTLPDAATFVSFFTQLLLLTTTGPPLALRSV